MPQAYNMPMKALALIAHDAKKDEMVAFCLRHKDVLARYPLLATGTTGARIQEATGLAVERVLSGPLGGDLQIGARVAEEGVGGGLPPGPPDRQAPRTGRPGPDAGLQRARGAPGHQLGGGGGPHRLDPQGNPPIARREFAPRPQSC